MHSIEFSSLAAGKSRTTFNRNCIEHEILTGFILGADFTPGSFFFLYHYYYYSWIVIIFLFPLILSFCFNLFWHLSLQTDFFF